MPILGLDFGTTNTVAAWLDEAGRARFVPVSDDGVYTLPSAVCFHKPGAPPLVGEGARQMLSEYPETTVLGPKRFLGRRFASDFVGRYRQKFSFPIVEGPGGIAATEIFGEIVTFEEVSGHIVRRVLEMAAGAAGEAFTEAVVSFPAHFHYRQRRALRRVVERAGLRVRRMVTEPTAAAVSVYDDEGGKDALVFDMGGGTFDATVIHTETGVVEVRGTGGDVFLGGHDFDERVTEALIDQFQEDKGVDLREDSVVHQRVLLAAEAAKIVLSEHEAAKVRVPCAKITDDGFLDLEYYLDRADLDHLCDPLLERSVGIASKVLQSAGIYASELDDVVLIGGQTRMPRMRERVAAVFGLEPNTTVDPSLGVALGAARVAAGFGALRDAVSVPIYAMTPGRGPQVLFAQNQPVPDSALIELPAAPPGDLPVVIYEAVDATAIDRDVLGKVIVPRDWLLQHGPATLRVSLNRAFTLGFEVEGREGEQLTLGLDDPSASTAPRPARGPAPVELAARLDRSGEVDAIFPCEIVRAEGTEVLQTQRIGPSSLVVSCDDPPSPGTRLGLRIAVQPGPIVVDVEVVESMAAFGAARAGRRPGFVAKVEESSRGSSYQRLVRAARATGGVGEDTGRTLASPDPSARVPREVRRFVTRVRDNDLYGAFRMTPLDSGAVLEEKVQSLTRVIADRLKVANPEIAKQLMGAARLLERVANALRDPQRRLAYDMQSGYTLVDQRLKRAGEEPIFDLELLRAAWRHAHPEKMDEAERCRAHAAHARESGDPGGALSWLERAVELDPFNAKLRDALTRARG